uniref:DJ-1/PfpI domain-containing protein n=1 Tax=Nelumbo nucifera TaxID=4432 RepID=A0A822Y035_NELNU|nr:TPA_asm: hypothetical protein HUJ06_026295 [Nelumbo nucifera]
MEAITIIDVLPQAKANVVVKLMADILLDEAANFVQGGFPGAQAFLNSKKLVSLLRKQMKSNRPYGAICASPTIILEHMFLLKKARAYPPMCSNISDPSKVENRVVVDGNLITSREPAGTSMGFSLAIVSCLVAR